MIEIIMIIRFEEQPRDPLASYDAPRGERFYRNVTKTFGWIRSPGKKLISNPDLTQHEP